jgi:2-haloacid dehalogenase
MLDLEPGQVMLAAAHNADLHAARALGLRTGFILRREEYGPAQADDLGPDEAWDVIVEDVCDLATKLGA